MPCYDAAYLRFFVDDKAEPTPLQRMENIDAAGRILETGMVSGCVTNYPATALKTPADVPELERLLQRRLLESESFSKKSPAGFPVRTRLFGDVAAADDGKKSTTERKRRETSLPPSPPPTRSRRIPPPRDPRRRLTSSTSPPIDRVLPRPTGSRIAQR